MTTRWWYPVTCSGGEGSDSRGQICPDQHWNAPMNEHDMSVSEVSQGKLLYCTSDSSKNHNDIIWVSTWSKKHPSSKRQLYWLSSLLCKYFYDGALMEEETRRHMLLFVLMHYNVLWVSWLIITTVCFSLLSQIKHNSTADCQVYSKNITVFLVDCLFTFIQDCFVIHVTSNLNFQHDLNLSHTGQDKWRHWCP